jgi:hypothetical protein
MNETATVLTAGMGMTIPSKLVDGMHSAICVAGIMIHIVSPVKPLELIQDII